MPIQETKMKMKTRETDDGRVLREGVLFRSGRVCFSSMVTMGKDKPTRRKSSTTPLSAIDAGYLMNTTYPPFWIFVPSMSLISSMYIYDVCMRVYICMCVYQQSIDQNTNSQPKPAVQDTASTPTTTSSTSRVSTAC